MVWIDHGNADSLTWFRWIQENNMWWAYLVSSQIGMLFFRMWINYVAISVTTSPDSEILGGRRVLRGENSKKIIIIGAEKPRRSHCRCCCCCCCWRKSSIWSDCHNRWKAKLPMYVKVYRKEINVLHYSLQGLSVSNFRFFKSYKRQEGWNAK